MNTAYTIFCVGTGTIVVSVFYDRSLMAYGVGMTMFAIGFIMARA